jgi:hypothetical protein
VASRETPADTFGFTSTADSHTPQHRPEPAPLECFPARRGRIGIGPNSGHWRKKWHRQPESLIMSEAKSSKGRGCFFYGCLTVLLIFLAGAITTYLVGRYVYNKAISYTSATAVALPKVELSAEKLTELQQRVAAFSEVLKDQKTSQKLSLTAEELNALFVNDPAFKDFKDKFHVALDGNKIKGNLSLPLKGIGWGFDGRYINGAATLKVALANGQLIVNLDALEVNGEAVSEKFMTNLRLQNLAQEAMRNPQNAASIQKFESIEVNDGKITIKSRAKE